MPRDLDGFDAILADLVSVLPATFGKRGRVLVTIDPNDSRDAVVRWEYHTNDGRFRYFERPLDLWRLRHEVGVIDKGCPDVFARWLDENRQAILNDLDFFAKEG